MNPQHNVVDDMNPAKFGEDVTEGGAYMAVWKVGDMIYIGQSTDQRIGLTQFQAQVLINMLKEKL